MLDAERFQRVAVIFDRARSLDLGARDAFLHDACGEEPGLYDDVMALLREHDDEHGAFESPVTLDTQAAAQIMDALPDSAPERVGRYCIHQRLGEGGMGVVFRAEQEDPRRDVALKLIRPGVVGRETLKRFRLETMVLGRLQHPGIAQIFEAGMYDDGSGARPFFAMELIDGTTLDGYVRSESPSLRERLVLFASICDAVHHAHQKGVIHRDLKPGNILVTTFGEPKILDFGVARATDGDLQVTTLVTNAGQLVGTLPYMSPEQVEGRAHELDTRSDVYALAVILYELVADRLPYDVTDRTMAQAARMITEQDPVPLSSIDRTLRGDVNTIVMKALEKAPDRRYQSASDLAADVRRFLNDEPITARPASTAYQLRKFARRNRALVGGVVATFVVLIAGVIASVIFAAGQSNALAESERQRGVAQSINDFLNEDLLRKANPYVGGDHDATFREVLDEASRSIETRFLDEPLVHASIRAMLGETYFTLGVYDEAIEHLLVSVDTYDEVYGPNHDETHTVRHGLALSHLHRWELDEAEQVLNTQRAIFDRSNSTAPAAAGSMHGDFGILRKRQGNYSDAVDHYRRAIAIHAREPIAEPRTLAVIKQNLALALSSLEEHAEAETLMNEVVVAFRSTSGPESADVAYALNNLGHVAWKARPDDDGLDVAEAHFEESYAIRQRRLGDTHPETLRTLYSLALVYDERGEHARAEDIHRTVRDGRAAVLGAEHIDVLESTRQIAKTLAHQDRVDEALDLYWEVLEVGQARHGALNAFVRSFRYELLRLLEQCGETEAMADVYRSLFAMLDEACADPETPYGELNGYAWTLATCEVESARDPEKAVTIARRAVAAGGEHDPGVLDTLAFALAATGRFPEAIEVEERALTLLPPDAANRATFEAQIAQWQTGATDAPK